MLQITGRGNYTNGQLLIEPPVATNHRSGKGNLTRAPPATFSVATKDIQFFRRLLVQPSVATRQNKSDRRDKWSRNHAYATNLR